jgi:hypothetical protein
MGSLGVIVPVFPVSNGSGGGIGVAIEAVSSIRLLRILHPQSTTSQMVSNKDTILCCISTAS